MCIRDSRVALGKSRPAPLQIKVDFFQRRIARLLRHAPILYRALVAERSISVSFLQHNAPDSWSVDNYASQIPPRRRRLCLKRHSASKFGRTKIAPRPHQRVYARLRRAMAMQRFSSGTGTGPATNARTAAPFQHQRETSIAAVAAVVAGCSATWSTCGVGRTHRNRCDGPVAGQAVGSRRRRWWHPHSPDRELPTLRSAFLLLWAKHGQ